MIQNYVTCFMALAVTKSSSHYLIARSKRLLLLISLTLRVCYILLQYVHVLSNLNITLGTVVELNLRGTKFTCTTVRCWIQSREVSCEYHIYNNKPEFIVRTPL